MKNWGENPTIRVKCITGEGVLTKAFNVKDINSREKYDLEGGVDSSKGGRYHLVF